ncbi:MAG: radical SAM protein [Candidatus Omnitrophota bacterium]
MYLVKKVLSKVTKYAFEHNKLKLLIKNKQVHLFYAGIKITRDIGLHSSFFIKGQWVNSSEGVWQVNIQPDILNITVDWEKFPLRQVWKIEKTANGFDWTIYLDVKNSVEIAKMLAGIIISENYKKWFTVKEEGIFPAFQDNWENIYLQKTQDKVFGLEPSGEYPGIIYKNFETGNLLLQNLPRVNEGRALRIEIDKREKVMEKSRYKIFKSNLSFAAEKSDFEKVKKEKIKEFLDSKALTQGELKISFDNSQTKVYWQNKLITAAQGMHSALFVDGKWLDSSEYLWTIEKIDSRCVYITIDYYPYPIEQAWQISIVDDDSFIWKVKTKLKEQRVNLIKKQTLGLGVSCEYKEWFGGYESGFFTQAINSWQKIFTDVSSGAIGVKENREYPGIMFENKQPAKAELLVQNADKNTNARYLQAIQDNENLVMNQITGKQYDFIQQIRIIEDAQLINKHLDKKIKALIMTQGIENKMIKLLVSHRRLQIFWQNQELTTDIGMHTAIYSDNKWYDSGKMHWQVNKISSQKMEITIDFKPFPVVQKWFLSIDDENVINWKVTMDIRTPVKIRERKAGLILKSDYQKWFNAFEIGGFPEKFGFWDDMIRNRDGETFGVYPAGKIPAVMFSVDDTHMSLIQNTDENIRGRVLQGQVVESEETKFYQKGVITFFRGKIKLTEDIKDIDSYRRQAQPLILEPEAIYIYGDSAQLHERIAGVIEFEQKINKIKQLKEAGQKLNIKIGVSRYNFFQLNEIIDQLMHILNFKIDLRSVQLNIFPLRRLRRNFIEYLDQLKAILKQTGNIELILIDEQLFELLTIICSQSGPENERQLLRMLGVICEHAFIGPQIVVVDPYHNCNANCIHCWVHTPGVTHDPEFYKAKLDFKKFKTIADDLSDLMTDLIIFQGDGEPLMHKEFFDMLEYTISKNIQASFFTNGILLDEKIARKAIDLGITEIFCSLPAGTPKTFAEINTKQSPETFAQILKNLRYLCELKKKLGKDKPRLILTHVIHTLNANELMDMAVNDVNIGADVIRFYLIRLDENIEFLKLKTEDTKVIKETISQIKELVKDKPIQLLDTTEFQLENFEQKSGNWSKDVFLEKGCSLGWSFSLIPAAGNVSFCCHLRTVGYLKDKSFKEIWQSPEYRKFRYQAKYLNKFKNEKFLNGTSLWDSHCQQCDTHQVIRDVWDQFKLYNLEKFISEK